MMLHNPSGVFVGVPERMRRMLGTHGTGDLRRSCLGFVTYFLPWEMTACQCTGAGRFAESNVAVCNLDVEIVLREAMDKAAKLAAGQSLTRKLGRTAARRASLSITLLGPTLGTVRIAEVRNAECAVPCLVSGFGLWAQDWTLDCSCSQRTRPGL